MSNDTQSTGSGTPGGRTSPWAPPGEGWVGSSSAPSSQQEPQQQTSQTSPGYQPYQPYTGTPHGQRAHDPYQQPSPAYGGYGQQGSAGTPYGGYTGTAHGASYGAGPAGTATADPQTGAASTPWYGTPAADPDSDPDDGSGRGGDDDGTRGGRSDRRRPSWGGVVAVAAVAALLAGGVSFGAARALDQTTAQVTASSSSGGSGSGSGSTGGSAGSVPLSSSVDWGTVAKAVEPSVVTIQVSDGQTGGEGTGIIFDTEGHVVTNNHVATAATGSNAQIRIILSDGRVYQGKIAGTDPSTDLAVIQIENAPDDLTAATFGDSESVAVGQSVMAIGNPLGLSDTVTTGIISATDRPVTTQASESEQSETDPFGFGGGQGQTQSETVVTNALQTDAAINPGNSGGPLVDAKGQVVGVNSSIASTSDGSSSSQSGNIGLGFAIPGNEVKRVASELIETGTAEHARLGVELESSEGTATVDGTTRQAAIVGRVVSGGAAASAGLKEGDAITAVNEDAVTSAESLTAQIRSRAPGDQVTLTIVRDGQQSQVPVTLGSDADAQG